MPIIIPSDYGISTLAGPISNTSVIANLASGSGALFAAPANGQYFAAVLNDQATHNNFEIVYVTGRSGDSVTIVRAQEGTEALNWVAGDAFVSAPTSGIFQQAAQCFVSAGTPNGQVAGTVASGPYPPTLCWDRVNAVLYACIATGPAATAQWAPAAAPQVIPGPTAASNLIAAKSTAGTNVTITADGLIVAVTLGGQGFSVTPFNAILNVSINGAGGMDVGSPPNNGFVSIYAIYNPSGNTSALLGTVAGQQSVYSGGNMPPGFIASSLLAVWPTTGSGQLVSGNLIGNRFYWAVSQQVLSNGVNLSVSAVDLSGAVPASAKLVVSEIAANETGSPASNSSCVFGSLNSASSLPYTVSTPNGVIWSVAEFPIFVPQTLYYKTNKGSVEASIVVTGYQI